LRCAAGAITISVSWQARGLTRHEVILQREDVVQTGLIAGDAGVDVVGPVLARLAHELRVGQEGPRHRHHVADALGQQRSATSGVLMRLVAISGAPTLPISCFVTQA
jgi:hypothetical protein